MPPLDAVDAFAQGKSALYEALNAPVTVLVISNVRLYREGLARSLARCSGIGSVSIADFSTVISSLTGSAPNVAIVDVGQPTGLDTARALHSELPEAKLVAFGVSDDEDVVLSCAAAGFSAYVSRDGTEEDLVLAIKDALAGRLRCSPQVAGMLFRRVGALSSRSLPTSELRNLTRREWDVLACLAEGLSNKNIARRLNIGDATAKNHVHSLLEKLGVRRRGEAAACFHSLKGRTHSISGLGDRGWPAASADLDASN